MAEDGGEGVRLVALRWLMGQMSSMGGHAYRPGSRDLHPLCIKSN